MVNDLYVNTDDIYKCIFIRQNTCSFCKRACRVITDLN